MTDYERIGRLTTEHGELIRELDQLKQNLNGLKDTFDAINYNIDQLVSTNPYSHTNTHFTDYMSHADLIVKVERVRAIRLRIVEIEDCVPVLKRDDRRY